MRGPLSLGLFGVLLVSHLSLAQGSEGPGFDSTPVELESLSTASPRPVTCKDLLTIRDLHGLSVSPDGKYVAFVVGQAVYDSNSYRSGLFVIDTTKGSPPISLGSAGMPQWDAINQWVDEPPKWSADGQYIMRRMRMSASKSWQVWRWNRLGGQPVQLTHVNGDVLSYEVAPEGGKLLLTVEQSRGPEQGKRLSEEGILYDGTFSVVRNQSVVKEVLAAKPFQTESWIHDIVNGEERAATQKEIDQFGPWVSDLDEKVLGKPGDSIEGHHIIDAKVSPDRRLVAYRYLPKDPAASKGPVYELFFKPVRGGIPAKVALPPDAYVVLNYWWSADSREIYYLQGSTDGGSPKLMAIAVNAGAPRKTFTGSDYLIRCAVNERAGHMVCSAENAAAPQKIVWIDLARGESRDLLDLNPEFKTIQLSKPVRVEGTNRFGDAWFAHVVKPLNYESGKRYPTILTTYRSGDYFLRGASGDENPIQVYAAHGFAVISFDFGRDRIAQIRPGNFDDFMAAWASPITSMEMAIQKGVEMGIVDPRRVGVTGYSRGTEQAAYAITHTNLFRAASGVAGDTSPFFYYMALNLVKKNFANWGLAGWPESETNNRWKQVAPDLNAENIHVPILNNDPDSEVIGDLSLYSSLKELAKPVELFIYPNELHHINQPKHRFQMYGRNLDWFRFWLKGEEDPDPAKVEQYKRWRELRKLQEKNEATPAGSKQ